MTSQRNSCQVSIGLRFASSRSHSDIGTEIAGNPRLQKTDRAEFIAMMEHLDLAAPTHLTEALRTNMSGGKTVAQLLAETMTRVSNEESLSSLFTE